MPRLNENSITPEAFCFKNSSEDYFLSSMNVFLYVNILLLPSVMATVIETLEEFWSALRISSNHIKGPDACNTIRISSINPNPPYPYISPFSGYLQPQQ